ncbi:outer membrane beta-barrel protein [Vibrio cionasavignyae]|uniref:outer membrane beta-barrel protein n=1 Tax=Vibrio cionasavignyae TaxID=2910252 RepID=UPI003D0F34FB
MKKSIAVLTLLSSLSSLSAYAADFDFQVNAGVDTNSAPVLGFETHVNQTYIIGLQANFNKSETYFQATKPISEIDSFKMDRATSQYSLYGGYRFSEGTFEGLSLKIGATLAQAELTASAKGTKGGKPHSESHSFDASEVKPFVGVSYEVYKNISLNVHHTIGHVEQIDVGAPAEFKFVGDTDYSSTTTFMVGYKF